jgi:hypothetical protein
VRSQQRCLQSFIFPKDVTLMELGFIRLFWRGEKEFKGHLQI